MKHDSNEKSELVSLVEVVFQNATTAAVRNDSAQMALASRGLQDIIREIQSLEAVAVEKKDVVATSKAK